jgi:hypothetical protein
MIKVHILKGNDWWVSAKSFDTPVGAFSFATKEAVSVLGAKKKGQEHSFYFRAEENGGGTIMAWLEKKR